MLENRDPYSLEMTQKIQAVIKVDPTFEGKGGFAYPLYVILTFLPLVYLPYDWAQAVWMVTLQWVAVGIAVVVVRLERWRVSPLGLTALALGCLFFYPVVRTIFLGQFTLHVTLSLGLTLLALRSGRDGWAGVFLALSSIKPQMVIQVGPLLVLWAAYQRRWRFVAGLAAGGVALVLAAMVLFPRWPLSFVEDVRRYSEVAGGRNPLAVLLQLIWPGSPEAARIGLVAVLVGAMLASWWRGRKVMVGELGAVFWTLVVGQLVLFQTGTTNQVILLIPLLFWLYSAFERYPRAGVVAAVIGLEIGLWALFLTTIHGDWEDPVLFVPIPLFCLLVLGASEIARWASGRRAAAP